MSRVSPERSSAMHCGKWINLLFLVSILCGMVGLPGLAMQEPSERPAKAKRVTLDADKAPLPDVLESLFTQSEVPHVIAPEANEIALKYNVTLWVKNAALPGVLARIMRITGARKRLTCHEVAGIYVIAPGDGVLDEKVSLTLKNGE